MSTEATNSAYPNDPTMLQKGLTKREYMAALAMLSTDSGSTAQERALSQAVELADALLVALHS